MKRFVIVVLLCLVLLVSNFVNFKFDKAQAYTQLSALNVDYYGGILMDVFYPSEAGSYPLMIYVHGGGWTGGNKSTVSQKMKDMVANDGYVVASINYGLAPSYKYPSPLWHIRSAINFLKTNAATYKIDVNKIGLYGDSAGGHLVALYDLSFDYDDDVKIVISNSGLSDLYLWDFDRDADPNTVNNAQSIAFYNNINSFVGYTDTGMQKLASPIWIEKRLHPSTKYLFIHCYQDFLIPKSQSKRITEKLRAEGYYTEYTEIVEAGHIGNLEGYWNTKVKPFILANLN